MNFLDLTNIHMSTEGRKEEKVCFIIKSRQSFLGHGVCLLLEAGKRIYGTYISRQRREINRTKYARRK